MSGGADQDLLIIPGLCILHKRDFVRLERSGWVGGYLYYLKRTVQTQVWSEPCETSTEHWIVIEKDSIYEAAEKAIREQMGK